MRDRNQTPSEEDLAQVRALCERLRALKFVHIHQQEDEPFANVLHVLERPPLTVRIVRDRLQWFVEISRAGWRDWFGPDVWAAHLDATPPSLGDGEPLSKQADQLLHNVEGMALAAAKEPDSLEEDLRAIRRGVARQRLGFEAT